MEKQYRFYNYKTYQAFLRDIDSIPEDAIVFIQDKLRIWTHGKEYVGKVASSTEDGIMKLYSSFEANKTAEDGTYTAKAVYDAIGSLGSASELTIKKDGVAASDPTISADGSTYGVFQGNTEIFKINVAKDVVVSDGEVITATGDEKTTTDGNTFANLIAGEKYIMMLLANSTKLLYIPVNALYKDYTFNDTDEIDFTDNNNVISAEIKSGSVAKGKLSAAVQASLDLADSALQSHQDISGKADKVAIVQQSESSVVINPNVLNVWGEISSLAITFTAGISGYVNEYMFQFTCPSSAATTLTLPGTIRWANDDKLEPEAGYTYQVSIVDNLAVYAGWEAQINE